MYSLIIRSPGYPPQKVMLVRQQCTVGRSVRADIAIPDSFASRLHVALKADRHGYILEDLKSANGTYHNGTLVVTPVHLHSGDVIRIGETDLEFLTDEPSQNLPPLKAVTFSNASPATVPEATIGMGFVRTTDEILNRAQEFARSSASNPTPGEVTELGSNSNIHDGKRDLLALVSKVGVALLSNSELDDVLEEVMTLVFEALPVERGYLMLYVRSEENENPDLICKVARTKKGLTEPENVMVSRHITEQVLTTRTAVLTTNAQQDPRFAGQASIVLSGMRSVMAVPLALGENLHGLIYIENPYDRRFTPADLEVLTTISSVAAIKIENARLLEERLQRQRLEEEIAVAARIQASMLPRCDPTVPGFEIAGLSRPAAGVGGDYYDFIRVGSTKMAVVIGDVTGHGISSGLMMALAKGGLLNQLGASSEVQSVMNAMNSLIFENGSRRNLMTFCYALIDFQTGAVTLSNAGHPFPYLFRAVDGSVSGIEIGSYPLGARASVNFPVEHFVMHPGDSLLLYSDGIVEASNARKELFGYQHLETLFLRQAHRPAREACEFLVESALKFTAGCLPDDDITAIVLKRC